MRVRAATLIGREAEWSVVHAFVTEDPATRGLVIAGEPGIGKTTLFDAAVSAAREHGLEVLLARPASAEIQLSFVALGDLLYDVDDEAIDGLPAAQRHALEVAMLRAEPDGPPRPHTIALALEGALRELAAAAPVLVAIDDAQWLDPQSADALASAARRVEGEPVRFLVARRDEGASRIEDALAPEDVQHVDLGPLSLGAVRRLLADRLELTLPRRVLRRVVVAAHGNPLFALEIGRALDEHGVPEIGEELVIPEAVEDAVGARVDQLAPGVRRVLLAASLSEGLRPEHVAAIADDGAHAASLEAGVVTQERGRIRPAHPLLAAAAKNRSREAERRAVHLALARAGGRGARQVRHLALAAHEPDVALANRLARAAAAAAARGAAEEAVELGEHALRLTPADADERPECVLALAELLDSAGADLRLCDLLTLELDSLPPGSLRGRAHVLLADAGDISDLDGSERHLELALAESGEDPGLRASVVALRATLWGIARVRSLPEVEAWTSEALPGARAAGPEYERDVLCALAWIRALRGRSIHDLHERAVAVSDAAHPLEESVDRVVAVQLGWRGEVDRARELIAAHLELADERGEAWSYVALRLHACEVALRAGDWGRAQRLLNETWEVPVAPVHERCLALLAVGRGDAAEAERWVQETLAASEATGVAWDGLEGWRARGIAALLEQRPEAARDSLRAVWEHVHEAGVDELGAFPVAPDLVEALIDVGEDAEAAEIADELADLAARVEHPWARISAQRCLALIAIAGDETAAGRLADAAAAYERIGLRFDHARTLLSLGRAARRRRKWGIAREALEAAAAAFDALGSPGWADRSRGELDRVGARRPSVEGGLTPTERRVAELAAGGMSNKQIAQALFITVHTVEAHLSRAYAKLGINSRGQLAGRLAEPA